MPPPLGTKTQTGCLVLFCAPFCLAGLAALGFALRAALSPAVNWLNVFGQGAFGLIFASVGFGLFYAQWLGRKKQAGLDALRGHYPESPWMWRADWSQGRVQSTTRSAMIQAWVFAGFWNLVSGPVFYFGPRLWAADRKALLILVFPAAGVGLLIWAGRETLRWEEFGKTWFDLVTLPGVVGKELRGSIHAHFPHSPERGVALKLSCVNRTVSGSGRDRTVHEKILWRDERAVSPGEMQSGPVGSAIPVAFAIPADGLVTDTENPNDSIVWVLEADAAVPGVDYKDSFEVPVFRTKDSPALTSSEAQAGPFASSTDVVPRQKPPDSRIVVRPSESGGTEFDFSAARNPGAAFGTTLFLLLWTGIVWFMLSFKAPIFFVLVFGFFDVVIFLIVLSLWLGTSRVVIGSGVVRVHSGILGVGRTREVGFAEISRIEMPVGMQTGGRSGAPYYDIRLALHNGGSVNLASAIRDKLEAEWLIAQMKAAIGLKS